MTIRSDVATALLEGIETSLTNKVPPVCFTMLPAEQQGEWREKLGAAVDLLCDPPDSPLYDPHQVGGGPGGGGGEGQPPPGVLYGAVTFVDDGLDTAALPVRRIVLGEEEGPQDTLPNGTGIVQRYRGGVVLINPLGADPFVISLENLQAMAPAGRQLGVAVPDLTVPIPTVSGPVTIQPGKRVTLVVLPEAPSAP